MPGTRRYDVEVNGWPTTLLLSDEDAQKLGVYTEPGTEKPKPAPKPKAPAKPRAPRTKKGPAPANKAATPEADKATSGPAGDA